MQNRSGLTVTEIYAKIAEMEAEERKVKAEIA